MRTALAAFAAASLVTTAAHAQNAAPERLDIDAAVQRALEQTPGLAAARAQSEAASAQASSVRGRMLPAIALSEEFQHYSEPFNIAFPGAPAPLEARKQDTNAFVAAANQPLLGLLHITQDYAAANRASDAAGEQARVAEATVREQVQTTYLRYFEALSQVEIAKASEAQLAEQRRLADARMKAGVITRADELRIETAVANAKLQEISAQSQADTLHSALLVTLGYAEGAQNVEFVEPKALLEQVPLVAADDATAQRNAEANRPEVKARKLQSEAASHQENARLFNLLPEVNAEAAYVKINGQTFASPEDKYIGVKATWPIFTWGADWYAYRAAQAQASAAAKQAEDQARSVRIDASQKLAQLRAISSQVDVANASLASAEEAYRVTNAQVQAGVATSTSDLLNAQSDLTVARANLARAKYERAVAAISLKRAVGQ